MFTCGDKLVTFIIDMDTLIFVCPDQLHDKFSELTNRPRETPLSPIKPKRKKLAWD